MSAFLHVLMAESVEEGFPSWRGNPETRVPTWYSVRDPSENTYQPLWEEPGGKDYPRQKVSPERHHIELRNCSLPWWKGLILDIGFDAYLGQGWFLRTRPPISGRQVSRYNGAKNTVP